MGDGGDAGRGRPGEGARIRGGRDECWGWSGRGGSSRGAKGEAGFCVVFLRCYCSGFFFKTSAVYLQVRPSCEMTCFQGETVVDTLFLPRRTLSYCTNGTINRIFYLAYRFHFLFFEGFGGFSSSCCNPGRTSE